MSKPRKSPSANENWVRQETKDEYMNQAKKTLEAAKKHETETAGKWVKVSDKPLTFKRVIEKR